MKVLKGNRLRNKSDPYYIELSNTYSLLADFSANPSQTEKPTNKDRQLKTRGAKQLHQKENDKINKYIYDNKNNDDVLIDAAITIAEYERTVMAKNDITDVRQVTIDASHTAAYKNNTKILQMEEHVANTISTETRRIINNIKRDGKHVKFRRNPTIATLYNDDDATMLTYDSGADGHYLRKRDRKKLGLPILRVSAKKAGVANDSACNSKYVTKLPFPQLYDKATEADTFKELLTSLMSVGKTDDDVNISVFTKRRHRGVQRRRCVDLRVA